MINNKINLSIDKEDIYCPITKQIFYDPVTINDGHTYEKEAILHWMQTNMSSPLNGNKLENKLFVQNRWLKNRIEDILSLDKDLKKDQYKTQNDITLDDLLTLKLEEMTSKMQNVDRIILSSVKRSNYIKFKSIAKYEHSCMPKIINKIDFSQEHNDICSIFVSHMLSYGDKNHVFFLLNKLSKEDLDYLNGRNTENVIKPLFSVCRKYSEYMYVLVNKNINFDFREIGGQTVLHELCIYANFDVINSIFEQKIFGITKFINDEDNQGETPLFYACENTEPGQIIKYLVENGADISKKSIDDYFIHRYIESCKNQIDMEVLTYLMNKGLDVNVSDYFGNKPIHYLCKNKYISKESFDCIVGDPENLYHENNKGNNILHILLKYCPNLEIVKYLMGDKNIPYNVKNKKGETPIHILCKYITKNENAKVILKYICFEYKDALFMDINGKCPLDILLEKIK